jgi:anti-sigma factor RsiW
VTDQNNDPKLITAYLLGELSEFEQDQLEARYFVDDALFERLLEIEDDLIDRYARGDISDRERLRLERHFLKSPARRTRVRFAEAMLRHVTMLAADVRQARLSWWRELMMRLQPKRPD